jgi:hypothetical protein
MPRRSVRAKLRFSGTSTLLLPLLWTKWQHLFGLLKPHNHVARSNVAIISPVAKDETSQDLSAGCSEVSVTAASPRESYHSALVAKLMKLFRRRLARVVFCDSDILVFDIEPQAIEHAHIDVGSPNQSELSDDITPPSGTQHLELRQE